MGELFRGQPGVCGSRNRNYHRCYVKYRALHGLGLRQFVRTRSLQVPFGTLLVEARGAPKVLRSFIIYPSM